MQYNWYPYKKGKFRHRYHTVCEDGGRNGVMLLLANKGQKLPANHQKPGEEPETDSLLWFSGGTSPDNPWSQLFGLFNCETINFCL